MTRKHFEAIAKAIRESEIDGLEKNSLAIRLGNEFADYKSKVRL